MLKLNGKLKFVNVDVDYLKELHTASQEVYYRENDYDKKPYLGILFTTENMKYVIPLTSAKQKHKKWKNIEQDRFLIYEMVDPFVLGSKDIWTNVEDTSRVKHILSAIDVKKMIPVVDDAISYVNINITPQDTNEERNYKILLNKEYTFCLKIIDDIIKKADKVYSKQINTGKIQKFCCDFKALENVARRHIKSPF